MNYKTLLVDGPYLAHRSFSAPYRLSASSELDSTMMHSFLFTLNAVRKKFLPKQIIIAWESHGTKSWRKELNPNYKTFSKPAQQKYIDNLNDVQLMLYLLGVKQYYSPNNEADDVIANLSKIYNNRPFIVYSVDKDLMQLIDESLIKQYDAIHQYDGKIIYDIMRVREKFNVSPNQIPDLLSIWGDTSDNIEGLKGFGLKKTAKLLKEYKTLENIPEEKLNGQKQQALINKKLTTLNGSCKLEDIPNKDFKTTYTLDSLLDKYKLRKIKEKIEEFKLLGGEVSG